jgi:hypothetical protein
VAQDIDGGGISEKGEGKQKNGDEVREDEGEIEERRK